MANPSTSNVLTGKPLVTGGVLVAEPGTALPTDTTTAVAAAFKALGYITDGGLTKSDSLSSSTIFAWGGAIIATPQKSRSVTFKFEVAELLNPLGHQLVYGDDAVDATPATATEGGLLAIAGSATAVPPLKAYIFEVFSGAARDRITVPLAQVTAIGDVVYKDDAIASRELTITCFPDASGNYFYEYTDDGKHTA